jgi:hypothetical protein
LDLFLEQPEDLGALAVVLEYTGNAVKWLSLDPPSEQVLRG